MSMVVSVQAKMNMIWEAQHLIEAFSTPSQPGQPDQLPAAKSAGAGKSI